MPFQLNEAPNLVIGYLNKHKAERNRSYFWSILCCFPTFGISVGCCETNYNNEYIGCGYPQPLSNQEKAYLQALLEALHFLIIDKSKVPKENNPELEDRDRIVLQIQNTIRILEKTVELTKLKHGYLRAIQEVLALIKTRFESEMIFKESITITEYQ